MKRFLLIILCAAAGAPAWGVNYALTVSTTREIDASSLEIARAFGIPDTSRTETTLTFSLEPVENTAAYRLTFIKATQQTITGETAVSDVEKVGQILPGRWFEFLPASLPQGGVKRSPELIKDSEEVSYNILLLLLLPPGRTPDVWGGPAKPAVARMYGVNVVSLETAAAQALASFEGQEETPTEFSLSVKESMTQDTNVSKMVGKVLLEGAGVASLAEDGFPLYARADLTGVRERSFVIFGKKHDLKDNVTTGYKLLREGVQPPADWAPAEINAE